MTKAVVLKASLLICALSGVLFVFNNCSGYSADRMAEFAQSSTSLGSDGNGSSAAGGSSSAGNSAGSTGSGSSGSGSTGAASGGSGSGTTPVNTDLITGQKLYATNCAGCHGALATSSKRNRDATSISGAINSISSMNSLMLLSSKEISQIVLALSDSTPTPTPTPAPSVTTPVTCTSSDASVGNEVIHRLNNRELSFTLRDLLGFTTAVTVTGLPDNGSDEFDNNAAVLYTNADYIKSYLKILDTTIASALDTGTSNKARRAALIPCTDQTATCAQTIATSFLPRAFRRPATASEIASSVNLYSAARSAGAAHEDALRAMLKGALVSPSFLFRQIANPKATDATSVVSLSQWELASRLSYFIWSSMPDQALLDAAKNNQLTDAGLTAQVKRMLKDPKAAPLVDAFARQWLQLDTFDSHEVDSSLFPAFTTSIRSDMAIESKLLLQDIFQNDLSLYSVLNLNYTYANSRLAKYYGLTPATASDTTYVKTNLGASARTGILGHGSILTSTSHTSNTSIVYRGKWVLESLLCDVPPPPPDSVDTTIVGSDQGASDERMKNKACVGCHGGMDPIGIGMQRFDAVGHYRDLDEQGKALDTSGKLPDGTMFNGLVELSSVLQKDRRFPFCAAKKMASYALGRQIASVETCKMTQLGVANISVNQPVSQMVISLVLSDFFKKQTGQGN